MARQWLFQTAVPVHLERSPGTEYSHPVVSSVMTALCHENSGEDITSIVGMQASHMALLLLSCLDNGRE
jgi:hypothetical protein